MTKSTITRERLQEIADREASVYSAKAYRAMLAAAPQEEKP